MFRVALEFWPSKWKDHAEILVCFNKGHTLALENKYKNVTYKNRKHDYENKPSTDIDVEIIRKEWKQLSQIDSII